MNITVATRTLLSSVAVFGATALVLVTTSAWMPLVWDEGDTILRAETISDPTPPAGFAPQATRWQILRVPGHWPFTVEREGHPPLAALLIALGTSTAPDWLAPLTQARWGPMLFFALAVGAMYYRLQTDYRLQAVSLTAVAVLLTMPRLFAHAHFATLDGPLTAAWLLAWATFGPACRNWRYALLFGLALGLTLAAKFTGWLAPLPFLAWALVYRDRAALLALAIGGCVAVAVFVALNPPLWDQPLTGLGEFFALNLNRGARPHHNISTQFFGRMYNLDFPLPWYNTLVWTAITISPMPLVMGCMGIWSALKNWRTDRAALLLFCQWATLILVRALPWSPPHDAERLILPSFAFFAALAGVGIGRALYRASLTSDDKIVAQGWAKVMLAISLTAATFDSLGYFPRGLSYYNRLVGGLRGAASLGMEPTYYWDSLDGEALDWLAEHTAADEKIAFGAAPPANLLLLHRWGRLAKLPQDDGQFRWYVLQRRPSAWQAEDRWLIEHEIPAFVRSLSGVPLLEVYSFDQFERAVAESKSELTR